RTANRLLRLEGDLDWQEAESGDGPAPALHGVVDPLAQHLEPAADAQDRLARRGVAAHRAGEPGPPQPSQIFHCGLRTGQDDEVRLVEFRWLHGEAYPNAGFDR